MSVCLPRGHWYGVISEVVIVIMHCRSLLVITFHSVSYYESALELRDTLRKVQLSSEMTLNTLWFKGSHVCISIINKSQISQIVHVASDVWYLFMWYVVRPLLPCAPPCPTQMLHGHIFSSTHYRPLLMKGQQELSIFRRKLKGRRTCTVKLLISVWPLIRACSNAAGSKTRLKFIAARALLLEVLRYSVSSVLTKVHPECRQGVGCMGGGGGAVKLMNPFQKKKLF